MSEQFLKDPVAVVDYAVDWAATYLQEGEQITASSWFILPQGEVNDLEVQSIPAPAAGVTTVFITGGIAGKAYQLTNRITTDRGRTDDRSLHIRIEEK